jgi:hypothetical protein
MNIHDKDMPNGQNPALKPIHTKEQIEFDYYKITS